MHPFIHNLVIPVKLENIQHTEQQESRSCSEQQDKIEPGRRNLYQDTENSGIDFQVLQAPARTFGQESKALPGKKSP